jgi:hypothetical protein
MVYIQGTLSDSIRFGLVSTILMIILLQDFNELVQSILRPIAASPPAACSFFV